MLAVTMITPLDSLDTKPGNRSRKPLHRTKTFDGSFTSSSTFGRIDKDSSSNDVNGVNGVSPTQQPLKTCKVRSAGALEFGLGADLDVLATRVPCALLEGLVVTNL